MRDAEADIAEALSNEGWLTVLDGLPRPARYHRRMLTHEHWVRVPELAAGERSGLFAMEDALYGRYLRVGDPGPWAGPWAGIARLEMPSGNRPRRRGRGGGAGGWLPGFASALHRDARAPVRRSRASNDICTGCRGTHASPCARCARRCSNATAKDGRHDR